MTMRSGILAVTLLLGSSLSWGQWRKVGEPAKPSTAPKAAPAAEPAAEPAPAASSGTGWRRVGEAPKTTPPPLEPESPNAPPAPSSSHATITPPVNAGPPPETNGDTVIFRTETREVNVTFSATGNHGGAVANLTQNDVEVYEDGARRTITHFSRDRDLPLTLGIIVDLSGSQRGLFRQNRREALNFLRQVLKPQDRVFIVTFGEGIRLVQDDTSSMREIEASVGGWEDQFEGQVWSSRGGSPIYDTLSQVLRRKLAGREGRKALLVISDGEDTNSHVDAAEVTEGLQTADTMVYWLKTQSTMRGGRGMRGVRGGGLGGLIVDRIESGRLARKMRKVAIETGGRVLEDDSLDAQFRRLEEELRTQYTLSFAPGREQADGNMHTLEVRARDVATKLRHKPAYRDAN